MRCIVPGARCGTHAQADQCDLSNLEGKPRSRHPRQVPMRAPCWRAQPTNEGNPKERLSGVASGTGTATEPLPKTPKWKAAIRPEIHAKLANGTTPRLGVDTKPDRSDVSTTQALNSLPFTSGDKPPVERCTSNPNQKSTAKTLQAGEPESGSP